MDDVFFDKDWPVIEDIKGNAFYISNEIILSEADVEGILVERFADSDKDNPYKVTLIFNMDSWKRIRTITESIVSSGMAIIRDNTVISCPIGIFARNQHI